MESKNHPPAEERHKKVSLLSFVEDKDIKMMPWLLLVCCTS